VIELQNISKHFGSFVAVDTISLRVAPGEFLGFLGPNGAGKTTTIKMMTGLYRPTSGSCTINGFDIQTHPVEAKQSFGYVPDQPHLYDRLTGREFLFFVGGLFKRDGETVKLRIAQYAQLFEMEPFLDKPAEEYSQGMRQRVALAAALIHDPRALIVDEPLLGLDPRSAWLVKATLKQLTKKGMTVFMSTHLLRVVEELCDRIVIIKAGRIIYEEAVQASWADHGQLEQTFLEITR
jgi:ABC-2 type transport system ATP-binding protein